MATGSDIRYAKSGGVHVAYQVIGDGPRDLLDRHDSLASHAVERFWGRVIKTTGDGRSELERRLAGLVDDGQAVGAERTSRRSPSTRIDR